MPRNYVRKRAAPSYNADDIFRAVESVQNKIKTYRQAQEHYGVPISVIYHRIKGRHISIEKCGIRGRSTALSKDIELQIVNCLLARAHIGYPVDKQELKTLVGDYVTANNITTPFKNGIPGEDWYQGFMKRNNNISLKKPEHLQKARKTARNPEIIYDFYDKLKAVYETHDLGSADKSDFIFNTDESGFSSDPSRLRAIGLKGKPLNRVSGGSGRESTTVLACVSAGGTFLPPLIVFKGGAVQARWVSEEAFPGTLYAASSNGWMEEPQFYYWFTKGFIEHVKLLRQQKDLPLQTAVLLFDGHASHASIRIIEEALKNNIQLIRFPSHLTDRLQPLDKCVFGPIKTSWDKMLVAHGKSQMGKADSHLKKDKFGTLLGKVWSEAMIPKNIISGFVTTGVYPLDSARFPTDFFDPIDYRKYKQRKRSKETSTSNPAPIYVIPPEDKANSSFSDVPSTVVSHSTEEYVTTPDIEINPTYSPNCKSMIIDLSIRTSHPDPTPEKTQRTVVDIFARCIQDANKKSLTSSILPVNKPVSRLKQANYGEVLTATSVLEKLREVDQRKIKKCTKKPENKKRKDTKINDANKRKENEQQMKIPKDQVLTCESDEDITEEDFRNDVAIEQTQEVEYENPNQDTIKPGTYVLVDFTGGTRQKSHYTYVCVVSSILNDEEYSVTGFKSVNITKTTFQIVENDICNINFNAIKAILPDPIIQCQDRKLCHIFPGSVYVREK